MISNYIIYYLLVGVILGFFMEKAVRWGGENFSLRERFWAITLWPIMTCIFIYHFIKGFND